MMHIFTFSAATSPVSRLKGRNTVTSLITRYVWSESVCGESTRYRVGIGLLRRFDLFEGSSSV